MVREYFWKNVFEAPRGAMKARPVLGTLFTFPHGGGICSLTRPTADDRPVMIPKIKL